MKYFGTLVAVEGIDGSGTTTAVALVAHALRKQGYRVHTTREPSDLSIGKLIRNLLPTKEKVDERAIALLFAADRLEHYRAEIQPALPCNDIVLSDRYLLSSIAYQGEMLNEPVANNQTSNWIQQINQYAVWPDHTLLLDLPAEVALQRRAERGQPEERYDTLELQSKLIQRYRQCLPIFPSHAIIDANASKEEVQQAMVDFLLKKTKK